MTKTHLIYVIDEHPLNKTFIQNFERRYSNDDLVEKDVQEVFYGEYSIMNILGGHSMGHNIKAIIGTKKVVETLKKKIVSVNLDVEKLPHDYYLVYYSEQLAAHIINEGFESDDLAPLLYLQKILSPLSFVVIETDYFGGTGEQTATLVRQDEKALVHYSDGSSIDQQLAYPQRLLNEPINAMLRGLGVKRDLDKDEFDTLELWKYRRMDE